MAKYSTTFVLLGLSLFGFLLTEFEEMRTATAIALGLVFFIPIVLAPEIIFCLLGTVILTVEDFFGKKK
ncbi:hypothetical protein [Nitrospira sp. M1]